MFKRFTISRLLWGVSLVLALALAWVSRACLGVLRDRDRLLHNQGILLQQGRMSTGTTSDGKSMISTPALTLKGSEFRQSGDTLVHRAKAMGIKPGRVTQAATLSTEMEAAFVVPIRRDTLLRPVAQGDTLPPLCDSIASFRYSDPWLSLSGTLADSLLLGTFSSRDTLDIVVHRVPKRFLFFRFGCKAVRLNVASRNPHTRLTYARYYQLVK